MWPPLPLPQEIVTADGSLVAMWVCEGWWVGLKSARYRELTNARCRKRGGLVVREVWHALGMGVHGPGVSEL